MDKQPQSLLKAIYVCKYENMIYFIFFFIAARLTLFKSHYLRTQNPKIIKY